MTYGDVEAFLAILRNGSITGAAEALFISQPALSRKLKSLEQELGVRLFEREQGRHSLTLTAKGQEFAPLAEKWMSLHRETEYYKSGDAQATLKIGAVDSIHTYLLPPVLQAQLRLHPEVRLSLTLVHDWTAYSEISERKCDLAFVDAIYYAAHVRSTPMFRDRMLVVSRTPFSANCLSPSSLNCANEVCVSWTPEFLEWHDYWYGISNPPKVSVDKMSLMEYFLMEKDAWALMPSTAARALARRGEYFCCELDAPPPDRTCYLLQDSVNTTPPAESFLETFRQVLRSNPDLEALI